MSYSSYTSKLAQSSIDEHINRYNDLIKCVNLFDQITHGKYHEACEGKLSRIEFAKTFYLGKYIECLKGRNLKAFSELSVRRKIGVVMRAFFPGVAKVLKL